MIKLMRDINYLFRTFKKEIWVLFAAFIFALAGDLLYCGVEGAEAYLVGVVLGQASDLFFTVFLIMVLFHLLLKLLTSKFFHNIINHYPNEPKPKIKQRKKK